MTARKKKTTGKGATGKLKVRKETIKDLDARRSGKNVKGGWGVMTVGCPTADCPVKQTAMAGACGILIG